MKQLFQVALFHRYFADGVFRSCELVPDEATSAVLQRHALVLRTGPGQIGVYCDSSKAPSTLLGYLNERMAGAPLQFLLTTDETWFAQVTDLPLDYVGQVALSTSSTRLADNTKQIALVPAFGPRAINRPGVIGMVSVFLADCLAAGGQDPSYRADFQARVLHWQYYVVNRSERKLHKPVICNEERMVFDPPVPITLPSGEAALSFSSGSMQFPVQEDADMAFDLVDHLPGSRDTQAEEIEHCLIRGLPTPDGTNLKVRQAAQSAYAFGEMYVYL